MSGISSALPDRIRPPRTLGDGNDVENLSEATAETTRTTFDATYIYVFGNYPIQGLKSPWIFKQFSSQVSNNSTGTIEKNLPKSLAVLTFSCGTIGGNSRF